MDPVHGFYRMAGLLLIVMAVWITIWLDSRLGLHIQRRPWILLVAIVAILLVAIAAVLIYRAL